ncbi:MAG: hypothetical protein WB424_04355 [Terracidiphilus sp.]
MPSIMQGLGFRYYGHRDLKADGSYITTKFFCVLYLPVVPIATFRVIAVRQDSWLPYHTIRNTILYKLVSKDSLNLKQIFLVYMASVLFFSYGLSYFFYFVPFVSTHFGVQLGEGMKIILFAFWLWIPWLVMNKHRKNEYRRIRDETFDPNNPRVVG